MVDIATVSVVSSATLAGLTIAANVLTGERQRRHEADLDFEKRVWERKSDALFEVIDLCRRVIDGMPLTDDNRLEYALDLSKTLDDLSARLSAVEAFASSRCRQELTDFMAALRDSGVKHAAGRSVDHFRSKSGEVSPLEDLSQWQRYVDWRKEAEADAVADFKLDLPDLRARAERLLEAARESVRRPKD
jgi:hypothetical protein